MKDSVFTAAVYDYFMVPFEALGVRKWRRLLWSQVKDGRVLDVGAGTGLNVSCYRSEHQVIALDNSGHFLERARRRARKKQVHVEFVLGDVQNIPFGDAEFDSVISTFLFCQLHNPQQGFRELHRVLKPGGQLLMLEHVRSNGRLGRLLDMLSWPVYRLTGNQIARNTAEFAERAGFVNVITRALFSDVVKYIEAEKR